MRSGERRIRELGLSTGDAWWQSSLRRGSQPMVNENIWKCTRGKLRKFKAEWRKRKQMGMEAQLL